VKAQSRAAIARARNGLSGVPVYPDATSTLRLAFGTVRDIRKAVPICRRSRFSTAL